MCLAGSRRSLCVPQDLPLLRLSTSHRRRNQGAAQQRGACVFPHRGHHRSSRVRRRDPHPCHVREGGGQQGIFRRDAPLGRLRSPQYSFHPLRCLWQPAWTIPKAARSRSREAEGRIEAGLDRVLWSPECPSKTWRAVLVNQMSHQTLWQALRSAPTWRGYRPRPVHNPDKSRKHRGTGRTGSPDAIPQRRDDWGDGEAWAYRKWVELLLNPRKCEG